jgi:CubicO group peptidase (beta-lactamase class C family)
MGHRLVDGAVQNVAPLTERSALGAAGLLTTAEDWGRFLARFPRTERLSLGGHTAGFATHVEIAPAQRVSVLVMADLRDAKLDDLIAALTRHLNISTASP